jgi:hypothetical protein
LFFKKSSRKEYVYAGRCMAGIVSGHRSKNNGARRIWISGIWQLDRSGALSENQKLLKSPIRLL